MARPMQDYGGNSDSFLGLDLQYILLGVDLQVREDGIAYLSRFGDAESYELKLGGRSWGLCPLSLKGLGDIRQRQQGGCGC